MSRETALLDRLELVFAQALKAVHRQDEDEDDDEQQEELPHDQPVSNSELAMYLASSLVEMKETSFPGCDSYASSHDWESRLVEWWLQVDEDSAADVQDCTKALEIVSEGAFSLYSLPPVVGKFAVRDAVLGLLPQDGEWHPAIILQVLCSNEDSPGTSPRYQVRFVEYGSTQELEQEDIAFWEDDDDTDDSSNCRICHRTDLRLTFHHLVPRATHSQVSKRKGKQLIPEVESVYQKHKTVKGKPRSRHDWLQVYGVMVCRKCHSCVHRVETNTSLAKRYNTLESLLEHPEILKWRSWWSAKQA